MARKNWTLDETLLALDLYLRHRPRLLDDEHDDVVELSRYLRRRAVAAGIEVDDRFRNPNGVAMKLANLAAHDPDNPSHRAGLSRGAFELENEAWSTYGLDPVALSRAISRIRADDVEDEVQSEKSDVASIRPRIFVTGMWGFNPGREGYVGFTTASIRDRFIADHQPGDLMLIIGQQGEFSKPGDVGRVLGLVDLDPVPIHESERFTPSDYQRKVELFGPDRWQHALPIRRAWEFLGQVKAKHLAPETCAARNARVVGANFLPLTEREIDNVMHARVRPIRAFGADDWNASIPDSAAPEMGSTAVSRGPAPSYGAITVVREDGPTKVYLLRLEGCVDALFPGRNLTARQNAIVKVGMSQDPERRAVEMNSGFPPGADAQWKVVTTHQFDNGDAAFAVEQRLLAYLEGRELTMGREFACVPAADLDVLLPALLRGRAGLLVS